MTFPMSILRGLRQAERLGAWLGAAVLLIAYGGFALPAGAQETREERPARSPRSPQSAPDTRTAQPSQANSRVRVVQDTTQYPYSAICKIIATFPDETTVEGSGTMIGPHHCLTALHLLYDVKTKIAAKRVRIIPGYDDERLLTKGLSSHPFGTTHLNQFLFWEAQDIAIVVTSTNIGTSSSWMTVGSRTDRELLSPTFNLGGYTSGPGGSERQSILTSLITRVEGDKLTTNGENLRGMEGGPIFARQSVGRAGEQDVWAIVGIQIGTNRGSRIPAEMRRILDKFLHDDFAGVNATIPLPPKTVKEQP